MRDHLETFLQSSNEIEISSAAVELSRGDNRAIVPPLIAALSDPLEHRRWGAVYALGFSRKDIRAIDPLIGVLLNREETTWVRSQAAECLGCINNSRAIEPLIECSRDSCPSVRFWCVFALALVRDRRPATKRRQIRRALTARLNDDGLPEPGMGWTIGMEAVGMMRGPRCAAAINAILADPLAEPARWLWIQCYWDTVEPVMKSSYKSAVEILKAAGHDPDTFGRISQGAPLTSHTPEQ